MDRLTGHKLIAFVYHNKYISLNFESNRRVRIEVYKYFCAF